MRREVRTTIRFDAAVVGGGFAGLAAAIAILGQAGKSVALYEKSGQLGGGDRLYTREERHCRIGNSKKREVLVIPENMKMEQIYTLHKPLLFSLAYRMLGSVMDAEDIVQEAFLIVNQSGANHIQHMKAYLCKIVTNRCLEMLRSTRKQREVYIGTWLPEPFVTAATEETDPMHAYLQKESVTTAYLLLLQQLSYVERAVFLLREVMQYDYEEIADIVGKSGTNCRQIFHRAKRSLSVKSVPDHVNRPDRKQAASLVEQFMHSLASGDTAQVMKILSTDAVLFTDGGGEVKVLPKPVHGHFRISHLMSAFLKKHPGSSSYRITIINGLPGIVAYFDGKTSAVISLNILDGKINSLYIVANPCKLAHVHK